MSHLYSKHNVLVSNPFGENKPSKPNDRYEWRAMHYFSLKIYVNYWNICVCMFMFKQSISDLWQRSCSQNINVIFIHTQQVTSIPLRFCPWAAKEN